MFSLVTSMYPKFSNNKNFIVNFDAHSKFNYCYFEDPTLICLVLHTTIEDFSECSGVYFNRFHKCKTYKHNPLFKTMRKKEQKGSHGGLEQGASHGQPETGMGHRVG